MLRHRPDRSALERPGGTTTSSATPWTRDDRSALGVPGHDAWVVGDERFVALEFESRSAEEYARD